MADFVLQTRLTARGCRWSQADTSGAEQRNLCSPPSCVAQVQHHSHSSACQGFDPCEMSAAHEQICCLIIPKTKSAESAAPWEELGMVGGKCLFNEDLRQNSDAI